MLRHWFLAVANVTMMPSNDNVTVMPSDDNATMLVSGDNVTMMLSDDTVAMIVSDYNASRILPDITLPRRDLINYSTVLDPNLHEFYFKSFVNIENKN